MPVLSLSIANPCHENWAEMSPIQRGAYCHACSKEVIDFTTWTDRELINYLSKASGVCGRLRPDQLRTHKLTLPQKEKRRWWVGIALVVSIFFCNSVSAQSERKAQTEQIAVDVDEMRTAELRNWSARRTKVNDTINEVRPDPTVEMFQGTLGGVCASIMLPGEEIGTWYSTIFDMLRRL